VFFRILVPHDYGPRADVALAWAVSLLRSTGGTLVLLHVIVVPAPPIKMVPMIAAFRPTEDPAESRQKLHAIAEHHGQAVEVDVIETAAADPGIAERARGVGANLIAVGAPTKGRGGVSRALLGSVVDHVVWHASCPVVVVRPPAPGGCR
jgi:nucleotide-binding universal stress UspA family protein